LILIVSITINIIRKEDELGFLDLLKDSFEKEMEDYIKWLVRNNKVVIKPKKVRAISKAIERTLKGVSINSLSEEEPTPKTNFSTCSSKNYKI